MPVTKDQAVGHLRKMIHLYKGCEAALESLELARRAEGTVNALTAEGDLIFQDIKILKSNKRTAMKQVEDWEKKAAEAKEVALRQEVTYQGDLDRSAKIKKEEHNTQIKWISDELEKAQKIHVEEIAKLNNQRDKLQTEINSLQTALENLVARVGKIEV